MNYLRRDKFTHPSRLRSTNAGKLAQETRVTTYEIIHMQKGFNYCKDIRQYLNNFLNFSMELESLISLGYIISQDDRSMCIVKIVVASRPWHKSNIRNVVHIKPSTIHMKQEQIIKTLGKQANTIHIKPYCTEMIKNTFKFQCSIILYIFIIVSRNQFDSSAQFDSQGLKFHET